MTSNRFFPAVLFGTVVTCIIILLFSLCLATLLSLTSLTEHSIEWLMLPTALLSLFIGGFLSGAKANAKGWIAGGLVAILFSGLVFLISYLGYNTTFSSKQLLFHAVYVAVAALGGMIGVNLSSQ
ncbi:TIGR04086 family membrane protein [Shouchella lonarensis]|uniref:Putative membrane protein, TIGR04086 family n=1 Tax=Shouchella lonarensis TaxID=1464122 RepID=A0A1G6JQS8_9BACI|nr:TIGR04086 family membrane protein [Shouchella lonarensis]SDC20775.1 putative membrane protein, TIGR04086 family [Shouchella lonarensis]